MPGTNVLLSCQHIRYWRDDHHAPRNGQRTWCYACCDMRDVVGREGDYLAACRDCRMLQEYGTDKGVREGVKRHLTRYPAHTVTVTRVGSDDQVNVTPVRTEQLF